MNLEELKNDIIVRDWLDSLDPTPNTERNYANALLNYVIFTKKRPAQLLEEAECEIRNGTLMRERTIKKDMIAFRKYLTSKGLAPLSIKSYLSGVRSFYRQNDIEVPSTIKQGQRAKTLEENNPIPQKEDLQEVLKVANPKEKALILVGCSSGLSSNEILRLTVGQIKQGYDPDTEITTLRMRRAKVGFDFITFLTPEASRAVFDYLDYRERKPKSNEPRRRRQLSKQRIYTDNDYLFICDTVPDEYLETKNEEIRKYTHFALSKTYRTLSEKAGKATPLGSWGLIRSHTMRKYYNSTMLNAGADSFFVEFTMGHTLDDTRSAYFRASPEKLREIYAKYVPYLTIQKELDVSASHEYKEIVRENEILRAETARHVVERSELATMKNELEEMKSFTMAMQEILKNPEMKEKFSKLL